MRTRRFNLSRTSRGLAVGVLVVGAGVVSLAGATEAAAPTQGTLSDTATTTSWTGGPFTAPNLTGTVAEAPDCSAPQS